jgi:2-oxoglutarate ferredoxin oxidoreductase subunit delta
MVESKRTPILPPPPPDKRYEIIIDSEHCDGCGICSTFCPKELIGTKEDKFNSRMLHYAIVDKPEDCAGCGQCERLCPTASLHILEKDVQEVANNE